MSWFHARPISNFVSTLRFLLRDEAFRAAAAILGGMLVIGTVFYTIVEGWSLLDSLYFSVIAASTVGFGDFAPQTPLGRAFLIVYVLITVGLLVLILSRIAGGMIDRRIAKAAEEPRRHRRIRRRSHAGDDGAAGDNEPLSD